MLGLLMIGKMAITTKSKIGNQNFVILYHTLKKKQQKKLLLLDGITIKTEF